MTTELPRITAQEAMTIMAGLDFTHFRTDTVLVVCDSKAEEGSVKDAATALLQKGYVGRVFAADLRPECEVLIGFRQPTFR